MCFFCICILLSNTIEATLNTYVNVIAFYQLMQIGLEQPIFVALLIRKLKLRVVGHSHYPKLFYAAAASHVVVKVSTTAMIWYYLVKMLLVDEAEDACSAGYI